MKILTINYHFSNNYGAIYEAYALQNFLSKNYCADTCCIDFQFNNRLGLGMTIFRLWKAVRHPRIAKRYLKKTIQLLKKDNNYLETQSSKLTSNCHVFNNFREKHLKITKKKYLTIADLYNCGVLNDVDIVICGSDVIWNISNESLVVGAYFLAWVPDSIMKVAYAPSWGKPNIDDLNHQMKEKIKYYLSRFDYISVREESGIEICASLGYLNTKWVPDPTMLLTVDEWNMIAEPLCDEEFSYVLNYRIPYNSAVNPYNILRMLHLQLNIPVINIPDTEREEVWVPPAKWLGAIRNATFVVTNSFHGVVFCLLYHKEFIFTELTEEFTNHNERIYSLLGLFDLKKRIVSQKTVDNNKIIDNLINKKIAWHDVEAKIQEWRQVGIDFLDDTLKKVAQKKKCSKS